MSDTTAKLTLDGEDISKNGNIVAIEYIDNDDTHADDLQIYCYDSSMFSGKEKMTCTLNTTNWNGTNKSAAMECGAFNIDSMNRNDMNGLYVVKAAATPVMSTIRQQKKNHAWERINLKDIAGQIAKDNDLKLIYAAELNPVFVRKEQLKKSDILFLSDLCKEVGLSLKFTTNAFVIYSPYEYGEKSVVRTFENSEKSIRDMRTFHKKNDTSYGKCSVSYIDPVTKEMINHLYILNETGRTLDITRKVSSTEEAKLAAKYAIREKNSKEYTGWIQCDGDISLAVGSVIELKGFDQHDMKYMIKKAIHRIQAGIYITTIYFEMVLEGY